MDNFVADAIFIDAPPAEVFRALVEPGELALWCEADRISGPDTPSPGGEYVFRRADGSVVVGEIVRYEPPHRLALGKCIWTLGPLRRGPMRIEWELEDRDGGVWLTVRQTDLDGQPGWKEFATATRAEWVRATVALKRHVEGI